MAIQLACSACRRPLTVADRFVGLKVRCPSCWVELDVPGAEPQAAAAAVPAPAARAQTAIALKRCPFCGEAVLSEARKCRYCGELLDRDLAVQKERERIEQVKRQAAAVTTTPVNCWVSLVAGALGLLIPLCAGMPGIVAVLTGISALQQLKANPRLKGKYAAVTGITLGAISIPINVLVVVLLATGKLEGL